MSGTAVIQAGCCCGPGCSQGPCQDIISVCTSGFQVLRESDNKTFSFVPCVSATVIKGLAGNPQHWDSGLCGGFQPCCQGWDGPAGSFSGTTFITFQMQMYCAGTVWRFVIFGLFGSLTYEMSTAPCVGNSWVLVSVVENTPYQFISLPGIYTSVTGCPTTPPPPPPPTDIGACCKDGVCTDRTQASCASIGGVWQGVGTSCAFTHCPPPTGGNTGACCVPQAGGFGLCQENLTEQQCLNSQGLFLGIGTTCGFIDCPPPPYGNGRESRGLGDTVANAIKWVSDKTGLFRAKVESKCSSCAARQAALNRLVPYSKGSDS